MPFRSHAHAFSLYDCISAIGVILKIRKNLPEPLRKRHDKAQNAWIILGLDNILRWFEHSFFYVVE